MSQRNVFQCTALAALSVLSLSFAAAASPLALSGGSRSIDQGLVLQAEIRCGDNGCWEVDRAGRPTGRRYYYGRESGRGMGPDYRGGRYVSPQAGIRCGDNGCWENDRLGRPTGRRGYYDDAPRY